MILLYWLVDNSLWLMLLLGVAAALLVMAWWSNRQRGYLYALGGVAGLLAALWLLTFLIVTPRQQIRNAITEMADGFAVNKPAQVVRHMSRDFKHDDITKDNAQQKIESVISMYGLADVYAWDFGIEELDHSKGYARVSFYIRVSSQRAEGLRIYLCRAEFIREDGQWRMKSFKRFNPYANTDQEIPYPQP